MFYKIKIGGFAVEFFLNTKILEHNSFKDFHENFKLNNNDLILTNEFIYDPYLLDFNLDCHKIFLERYGSGEPTDKMIDSILNEIKDKNISRVIAIGGGSILDVAKILALDCNKSSANLFLKEIEPVKNKELIAIPTTCGTGSEVTNISVAFLERENIKLGLAHKELFPDYAVLIPEFLKTLPNKFFFTSSIDALVHAVESFLSPKATFHSDIFAKNGIKLLVGGFKYLKENGIESRDNILMDFLRGSNLAGISFGNAGCGAVHALSYPLGGRYHIAHGESNSLLFIPTLKKYKEKMPIGKLNELENILSDILNVSSKNSINELEKLINSLFPKQSVAYYGIDQNLFNEFADEVLEKQQRLLNNNYVPLTKEEIIEIYYNI